MFPIVQYAFLKNPGQLPGFSGVIPRVLVQTPTCHIFLKSPSKMLFNRAKFIGTTIKQTHHAQPGTFKIALFRVWPALVARDQVRSLSV